MSDNENLQGLQLRSGVVTDQENKFYVHLEFALGMLSTGLAIPLPAVPAAAKAIRDELLKQHRNALQAEAEYRKSNGLSVIENKLIIPKGQG